MDAAAYYRVSSTSQNLEMQQHAVERLAAARGDTIAPGAVYAEKRSGKTLARPELDRLRADARAGRLPRRLYLFRFDRLTRSGIKDTLTVIQELRDHGVELVGVTDDFNIAGPTGEFVLAGMAFANQIERLAGEERRSAARERRRAQGLPWGRPRRVVSQGDQHAELLQRYQQRNESIRDLAIALKIPRATVGRVIKRAGLSRPAGGVSKVSLESGACPSSEESA